jgi:predicted RNA-binding Zn-ribbon protein involved in translation (DUF1610 family)
MPIRKERAGRKGGSVMPNTEPNKWYFAVDCSKCGEAIPFAEAPSPEVDPDPQFRTVKLQCPHCGTEDTYAPALMTRRQGPESK